MPETPEQKRARIKRQNDLYNARYPGRNAERMRRWRAELPPEKRQTLREANRLRNREARRKQQEASRAPPSQAPTPPEEDTGRTQPCALPAAPRAVAGGGEGAGPAEARGADAGDGW